MILESKEDMKSRGLDSPDDADALCLTFAMPVLNKSQKQFRDIKYKSNEYDPLVGANYSHEDKYNPLSSIA